MFVDRTENVSTFFVKVDRTNVRTLIFLIVFIVCSIVDDIFKYGLFDLLEKLNSVLQANYMRSFLLKLHESVVEFRLENTFNLLLYEVLES